MAKLDRLGWTAGLSFTSYGVRVGVRTNDPLALASFAERLPPGSELTEAGEVEDLYSVAFGGGPARAGVRRFHLLYVNARRLARATDAREMFERFESELKLHVAERAPRRVFVHAGVVGWKGRAILLPGRSFSGKTTLVSELLRAGAEYYSDEYAVLDAAGRVHPYARPLAVRSEGARGGCERLPPEAFGGRGGARPLRVGLVVLTKYREGALWRPRAVSPGRAALELLENTVSARSRPAAALAALGRVTASARALKCPRGEAAEAARSILERAEG